jgi:hypothetical protein
MEQENHFFLEKCAIYFCILRCLILTGVFTEMSLTEVGFLGVLPCQVYALASCFGSLMALKGLINVHKSINCILRVSIDSVLLFIFTLQQSSLSLLLIVIDNLVCILFHLIFTITMIVLFSRSHDVGCFRGTLALQSMMCLVHLFIALMFKNVYSEFKQAENCRNLSPGAYDELISSSRNNLNDGYECPAPLKSQTGESETDMTRNDLLDDLSFDALVGLGYMFQNAESSDSA